MFIQCENPHPIPPFSPVADHSKRKRLPLSALCDSHSSSRVTSPSPASASPEQTSSPNYHFAPTSFKQRRQNHGPIPLPSIHDLNFVSSLPSAILAPQTRLTKPRVPPIHVHSSKPIPYSLPSLTSRSVASSHVHLTSSSLGQTTYNLTAPPIHRPYEPRNPASSTQPDFDAATASSNPSRSPSCSQSHAAPILQRTSRTFQVRPLSDLREVPEPASPYSRRRCSSQSSSRVCANCGISQTRQWVRGENHAWLCHSCGQFWRKNGYPRPRALWNRPTFKRSSRKSRLVSQGIDGTRRLKGATRQSVSSSFLNGKKMIQWEDRLPPLHYGSSAPNDGAMDISFKNTNTGRHASEATPGISRNLRPSQSDLWRS